MSAQAQAVQWVVGIVQDAEDTTAADGHIVSVYQQGVPGDAVTGVISSNIYMVDCEGLSDSCEDGDFIEVMVINNGDGYTAGPVQVLIDNDDGSSGWDQATTMQLTPPEECIPGLSVRTDKTEYLQGSMVSVFIKYMDENCTAPIEGETIGIEVIMPNNATAAVWQDKTDENGEIYWSFVLTPDAMVGQWSIVAEANDNENRGTVFFTVNEPGPGCLDADNDTHYDISCGGDDPDDNDPDVYPGAPELCDNKDNDVDGQIDENLTRQCGTTDVGECTLGTETCTAGVWGGCDAVLPATEFCADLKDNDCDGSIDEGCGGGGGTGGGGSGSCQINWSCTDWSECAEDGTQTRTCSDTNYCGSNYQKPAEEQDCTYVLGAGCVPDWSCTDWSECAEDGTQTRTCTDSNACGLSTDKPAEDQECTYMPSGTEGQGDTGTEGPGTGGITGLFFNNPAAWYGIGLLVILVLIGAGYWAAKRNGKIGSSTGFAPKK